MSTANKSIRLRRRLGAVAALAAAAILLVASFGASAAEAAYGLNKFDTSFTGPDGSPQTQAGSHPFAMTTQFELNYSGGFFEWVTDGDVKDLIIDQVKGFVGDATAIPRCSTADFITAEQVKGSFFSTPFPACSDNTAVGVVGVSFGFPIVWEKRPVYNLEPPPGVQARLGFVIQDVPTTIDIGVKNAPDYNVRAVLGNTSQVMTVFGSVFQLWGDPSDPAHDKLRGHCYFHIDVGKFVDEFDFASSGIEFATDGPCPVEQLDKAFLTVPRACEGPLETVYRTDSWQNPGAWVESSVLTHDDGEPPNPQGFTGCGKLAFAPSISAKPTTDSAETGTGLDFSLDFNDEGLTNPKGIAGSDTKKAVVTLPEGVTVNPSIGEGLGFCSKADFERESLAVAEGEGCPNASKIGTVHVESPLIENAVDGSLYLAQQGDPATPELENPFDSLIALYIVLRNAQDRILVKIPAKVEPDPETGQLITTVENVPQLPFSHFNLHFREGQRAPLVSPPACGTYETEAKLYPWSDPGNPRTVSSSFKITGGIGQGPCPPGGVPPFKPHFEAGSINNNAGSFSPFNMRLIRNDGEQDMTKFSSILPPGVLGSLAGVAKCPDALVALAKTKTGREELAAPSCPSSSQIGRTLAGAGVGSALTYVGGSIYLGGPYKGAPLSVISITPAVAGPFDAGTVVVRLGLDLNPVTAEVEVDGAASDPIPHILKGIVLKVRDLRVYVDRPNFTLNPTSCDESSARAILFGSFLDVFDPADDVPVALATRYQAANCLNLGHKPHLKLRLRGGTRRGAFPGFRATYNPRPGDANVEGLTLRLPRSAFLEQGHIRTICTRVQFAAEACPPASRYGYIRAWTPLLDTPLEGPVYLRSSNNKLPDVVFDLKGLVDIEVATRIDSVRGGLRATLTNLPDAPISKVFLRMQGGKKGLIVNSRHLCRAISRANVRFSGQNGKQHRINPVMRASCGKKRKAKRAQLGGLSAVG